MKKLAVLVVVVSVLLSCPAVLIASPGDVVTLEGTAEEVG